MHEETGLIMVGLADVLQELWQRRVEHYWTVFGQNLESYTFRNVMDMKANLGSFAAALSNKEVWVMNVVPEDGPNTLKIVYDRGLLGSVHNWYVNHFFPHDYAHKYCIGC